MRQCRRRRLSSGANGLVCRVRIAGALCLSGLVLGGAGVAGSATLSAEAQSSTARPHCAAAFPRIIHDGFPEPPIRFSHGGLLDTRLRASVGPVTINHHRYTTMSYEGNYPGPTFVL